MRQPARCRRSSNKLYLDKTSISKTDTGAHARTTRAESFFDYVEHDYLTLSVFRCSNNTGPSAFPVIVYVFFTFRREAVVQLNA